MVWSDPLGGDRGVAQVVFRSTPVAGRKWIRRYPIQNGGLTVPEPFECLFQHGSNFRVLGVYIVPQYQHSNRAGLSSSSPDMQEADEAKKKTP